MQRESKRTWKSKPKTVQPAPISARGSQRQEGVSLDTGGRSGAGGQTLDVGEPDHVEIAG